MLIRQAIITDIVSINMEATTTELTAAADRRRWIALLVVCMGQLMIILDTTIVNVALPSIQDDVGFSNAGLTWVVNAYLISFGSFLLLAGRLGDLLGRRRVFLFGIVLFTIASVLCGLSQTQAELIGGRFLQGVGGALASAVVLAIIVTEFPRPADRARAMSLYTLVVISGGSVGLLLGGVLTESLAWHWIFFVNVPIGIVAFVLGRAMIDKTPGLGIGAGVDWLGSLLVTLAMMVGVYAIVKAPDYGWGSPQTLGIAAASLLLLGAFVWLESRLTNPIMPLRVFRLSGLVHTSVVRALLVTGIFSMFFLRSVFLERVEGYSPLQIGASFLPQTLVIAALSMGVTAMLLGRFGPRRLITAGLLLVSCGLVVFALSDAQTSFFPAIFFALALIGLGAGTAFMPLMTAAVADVRDEDAGLASGIVNVSLQIGGAIGLAALGSVAATRTDALRGSGHAINDALTGGYQLAYWLGAGLAVLGAIYAWRRIPEPGVASDEDTVAAGAAAVAIAE
jgi:EmrB/QacA subfamily drug resistance transporter